MFLAETDMSVLLQVVLFEIHISVQFILNGNSLRFLFQTTIVNCFTFFVAVYTNINNFSYNQYINLI